MASRHACLIAWLFVCFALAACASGLAQTPPAPWTPPHTSLPPKLVDAIAMIFEHGVPDPRGGEFREVTISAEARLGESSKLGKVTGWVLPTAPGAKPVAICWNGLPYEPTRIGPKRDLAALVRNRPAEPGKPWDYPRAHPELFEAGNPRTMVGAAMLLRTGRADLAEEVVDGLQMRIPDLLCALGDDVVWFRSNRAVGAHARADDDLAALDAAWLADHSQEFAPLRVVPGGRSPDEYCDAGALLEDARRRIRRGFRRPFDPAEVSTLPLEQRIREIVDRLDDLRSVGSHRPERYSFDDDPAYRAALDVGKPMLNALADSAQTDTRLTRDALSNSDRRTDRSVCAVSTVACQLIYAITGSTSLPYAADGKVDWAAVRAGRMPVKHLPSRDDSLRVLADDAADHEAWVSAAIKLVPARGKNDPTIAALIAKRCLSIMLSGTVSGQAGPYDEGYAMEMARFAAASDPSGSRRTLKTLYDRLAAAGVGADPRSSGEWKNTAREMLCSLTRLRLIAGDDTPMRAYEDWVLTVKPNDRGGYYALAPILFR